MEVVVVTGGAGFIGSNLVRHLLLETSDYRVVNIDKLTYAGRGGNIEHMGLKENERYRFAEGDICDRPFLEKIFSEEKPRIVINTAAESHVDNSIDGSAAFVRSNVLGATNLFDASLKHGVQRVVQISTDEVYGSIREGSFTEESPLDPSSPYSGSKAAAECMALSYHRTHKLPVLITNSANNYGVYQYPEKILPKFITKLIMGQKVPLMYSDENPGLNVRDWLHVEDNCRAIWLIANKGKVGERYNIPGENEFTNMAVTRSLLQHLGLGEDRIEKVEHRKAHDFRYSVTGEKLKGLGFEYKHKDFPVELRKTIDWYVQNRSWWEKLVK